MRNNMSPFRGFSHSPSKISINNSANSKKKTVHQHWKVPKIYINQQMSEQDVIELKSVFDEFSSSQSGILIPADLCAALRRFGFNATNEIIYDIIVEIDQIEQGGISFTEFINVLQRRPAEKEQKQDFQWAFKKYDNKNKGYIDEDDFRRIARQLQQDISQQQIRIIMDACGGSRRQIKLEDFSKVMTSNIW